MPTRYGARISTRCCSTTRASAAPTGAKAPKSRQWSSWVRARPWSTLRATTAAGYQVQARYLLDASGREAFLASKKKIRDKNPEHQSAAIFGHFHGAEFRPGADAGNISIYNFDHGWMWMIPLPSDVMSVGAVCRPDYLKQRRGRTEDFFFETLKLHPAVWKRVEEAKLIDDEVRVTGNYSYDSTTHRRSGLDAGGRRLRVPGPGVLLGRLSRHELRRAGCGGGGRGLRDPSKEPRLAAHSWRSACAKACAVSPSSSTGSIRR